MWIEQEPKQNDTVKIEFADWTKLGTKIGIVDRIFGPWVIVDFGDVKRWFDRQSSFFIYKP